MNGATADQGRTPCPNCQTPVLSGARKCRGRKRWLVEPPSQRRSARVSRSLILLIAAVVAVAAVLVTSRQSPVGEAPPLTPIDEAGAAVAVDDIPAGEPAPAALGPDPEPRIPEPLEPVPAVRRTWSARQIQLDIQPLDVAFSPRGETVLVSDDDATLREYDLATGKLVHMASMPAQGDRIRLLHDRYVAVIRHHDAAHIPVMDTQNWDRDPVLLWIGFQPADVLALADGKTAVAASSGGKRLTWFELGNGRRLGDIRLPHATRQLYLLSNGDERPYVGAIGMNERRARPDGAWIDLFDPLETPFGATRRSVAVGRDPRRGTVTRDGSSIFFVDRAANVAAMLRVDPATHLETVPVGNGPIAAFLMNGDRYGVTLDGKSRTASIIDAKKMSSVSTIMLEGTPFDGAVSPDGALLFVSLGGSEWPPRERGALVIAGDAPEIVARLHTGRGASRVAVSPKGTRAVVANYADKALTVIQP